MFLDYNFRNYNYRLFLYVLLLNITGVLIIRSASNQDISMIRRTDRGHSGSGLTAVITFIPCRLPQSGFCCTAPYGTSLAFLLAVLVFGVSERCGHGAGWCFRSLVEIQPSEFVKIGLIIFFPWYLSRYQERDQ
ncbi:MAG: FtsW/RodA/SpoVE family cell cycle protein [Clostridium sp.]